MQPNRLPSGGRIDRSAPLSFSFNGREYQGYQGDTLASALLANDVRLVARSFKYHRPRGIVGAGSEEPNALVQLGSGDRTLPNYLATQVELYDGLDARHMNQLARDGQCDGWLIDTLTKDGRNLFDFIPELELRDMVMENTPTEQLRDCAQKQGMVPLRQAGIKACLEGSTTPEEVIRETIVEG